MQQALRYKQRGHFNFNSVSSFFAKPKPPAPDPNAAQNVDPATGKPRVASGDIDPNTGMPRAANQNPNDPANLPDPNKSKNPLDIFDGMWDNKPKEGEKAVAPAFALDPEALKKVTEQLSFAPQLTPELLEKFKEGDAKTISDVLNSVGRQSYTTLMQHLPALTDKFVAARLDHDRAGLGRSVRESLTANSLEKLASKNPVLKQQLDTVVTRLYDKYPDATPDWVAEQATKYFSDIARELNPEAFKPREGDKPEPRHGEVPEDFWAKYITDQPSKT